MITTDKTGVSALIKHCLSYGMTHFVCSPGSRNAPIVIALDEHPDVHTIIIHDDRSAGFYALGMAQQLQAPVGLVCTSGSAMLNYYPAVAEAYYQCVPLSGTYQHKKTIRIHFSLLHYQRAFQATLLFLLKVTLVLRSFGPLILSSARKETT